MMHRVMPPYSQLGLHASNDAGQRAGWAGGALLLDSTIRRSPSCTIAPSPGLRWGRFSLALKMPTSTASSKHRRAYLRMTAAP